MYECEKKIVEETTERFDRVVNLIISKSKTPRDYGSGEMLHFAEIHAINFIGLYKRISVTELSQHLGVTKGTVSSLVSKLEKKNYVKKTSNLNDGRSFLTVLTEKGETARKGFKRYQREFYSKFSKNFSFGQFAILNEFLVLLEEYLKDNQSQR